MPLISRAILLTILFLAIVSAGYALHQQRDMAARFDRLQDEETGRQIILAEESVRRQVGQLRAMAGILALRNDVRTALHHRDAQLLGDEFSGQLGALAVETGVSLVRLVEPRGKPIHESILDGEGIATDPGDDTLAHLHQDSLRSARPRVHFHCAAGCHVLIWAPVLQSGRAVGTVMVAAPLADILLSFYRVAGTEAGLARRDAASSLVAMTGGDDARGRLSALSGEWHRSRRTGGEWQQIVADGRHYRVSRWSPVFGAQRLPVDFLTLTDVEATRQEMGDVLRTNVATALGWMVLAIAILWLLSRRLIARLRRIGGAIRQLETGASADIRDALAPELKNGSSADEIGGLAVVVADVAQRLEDAEIEARHRQTEHERLQYQLQQAHKMEAVGQLAGGIAHDFNNILASIMGYAVLARDRFAQDGEGRLARYLGEILRASERARDLVSQLLAFSRQEVGKRQRMQIEPLLKELGRMLSPLLPAAMSLRLDLRPAPPVLANPMQIQQIVMNLALNARDATDGRGRVTIGLRYPAEIAQASCASCHGSVTGPFVELSVADDGPGIATEHLTRIFEPFFTTKEPGKGTGMGLAIVHGLIHEADGHLLVETATGGGTVFRVLLPAAPDPLT